MLRIDRRRAKENDQVYRVRSNIIAAAIWLVLVNGFAISIVIRASGRPLFIALAILCAAMSTALLVRLLLASITTSPKGVHVSNIFESFDLRWHEIQRFEMGRWKIIPRTCIIHLRDGRVKHAAGIEESANFPKGDGERMVEELNEQLTRRQRELEPDSRSLA